MNTIVETIVFGVGTGLISGVFASFIFWYSLTHWLTPKISISPKFSKLGHGSSNSGYFYQFKIENSSVNQVAIDISCRADICYPDFPRKDSTNVYAIPLDVENIVELLPNSLGNKKGKRIRFLIESSEFCKSHKRTFFSEYTNERAIQCDFQIEDLFDITEETYIRVYIIASSQFSGARKIFKQTYKLKDMITTRDYFGYKT